MSTAQGSEGTLEVAFAHAQGLLRDQPALAVEQALEILQLAPGHPGTTLLLGMAQRLAGDATGAVATLAGLAGAQPRHASTQHEYALALSAAGQPAAALVPLRQALVLHPELPDAWRLLGDLYTATGEAAAADAAYARHIRAATRDPRLQVPALALCENRIPEAEALLRRHLKAFPTDVAAIRMLAEVAARLGRNRDAGHLLERCLELAPGFDAARHNYAIILNRQNQPAAALQHLDALLLREPHNPGYRNLKAAVLARIGDCQESIEIYAELLERHPEQPKLWMSYGHALSAAGREPDSIAAYRQCIEQAPAGGEAYWSLANLKTFRFTAAERAAMQLQLAQPELPADDRLHFHFALGKALEDAAEFATAFVQYAAGNHQRRAQIGYSAAQTHALVLRSQSLLTPAFFAARATAGASAPDPIFIVGLPRAGSTLIEQILASHSLVEGTMELPNIINTARTLADRRTGKDTAGYLEVMASLPVAQWRELGERYLAETRIHRQTGRPFFIDKMPNNFLHLGLIRLMLPNAKIIDARRHPMACCFSSFKQHFARGQHFSYDLTDLGRYYGDYVALLAHYDAVFPGQIHRVIYERMIDDTETEVRRLLEYCGLPFEAACLQFHTTQRAVKTASAQQVRQPIFREGLEHWRHFEPWLGALSAALGPVLEAYPEAPAS